MADGFGFNAQTGLALLGGITEGLPGEEGEKNLAFQLLQDRQNKSDALKILETGDVGTLIDLQQSNPELFKVVQGLQAAQKSQQQQQGIQNLLQQQLGGGLNVPGLTEPQGIVAGEGINPGNLAITPGGSIGVQPSRVKPFTQSVADTERNLAVGLLGIKGGREAFSKLANVFKTGREDEILAAAKEVEDIQGFALKLDRAQTRKARNKLIEDEQSRQIIDTGQIDPELLRMRNMTDDELQGEIISDLAVGDSLKKLVDNRLAPVVEEDFTLSSGQKRFRGKTEIASVAAAQKPPTTRERKVGDQIITEQLDPATGTFKELSRAPRFKETGPLVTVSTGQKESEKLAARSDAAVRDEVRGNARIASRELGKIRSLSKLLESTGTGALKQFAPQLSRIIPGLDFTNEQAAQAQINQFVLDRLGNFKGPTSDRELAFVNQTIQNLGNTPEANRIITRSLENVIFLAQQENRQFNDFVKGKGKPRDFVFDFQEVIFPDHPTFGSITLDDVQTTAFENGITMEKTLQELRKR